MHAVSFLLPAITAIAATWFVILVFSIEGKRRERRVLPANRDLREVYSRSDPELKRLNRLRGTKTNVGELASPGPPQKSDHKVLFDLWRQKVVEDVVRRSRQPRLAREQDPGLETILKHVIRVDGDAVRVIYYEAELAGSNCWRVRYERHDGTTGEMSLGLSSS